MNVGVGVVFGQPSLPGYWSPSSSAFGTSFAGTQIRPHVPFWNLWHSCTSGIHGSFVWACTTVTPAGLVCSVGCNVGWPVGSDGAHGLSFGPPGSHSCADTFPDPMVRSTAMTRAASPDMASATDVRFK